MQFFIIVIIIVIIIIIIIIEEKYSITLELRFFIIIPTSSDGIIHSKVLVFLVLLVNDEWLNRSVQGWGGLLFLQ